MKISIVIPAFNQQALLMRSLETLSVQKHEFHECIVMDDGSDPPLFAPSWVRLVRIDRDPAPRGSSAAKNRGADLAEGDTLVFADSDILHMPDAILSLKVALEEWESEGESSVLLNVVRISLPDGFPARRTRNVEGLLKRLRISGSLIDEEMEKTPTFWEQNCGMIRKPFFTRIGGYDAQGFPSWGFNNHDLCARVFLAGGRVSSHIKRPQTGMRLFCFHIWHDAARDRDQADKEFAAKWGEKWTTPFMDYIQHRSQREREDHAVSGF